ncbi:hypothetical protein GCM10020000_73140 [Streptomyces olivoverticillatus]
MNGWLAAAAALTVCGIGPSLWGAARGGAGRRVVAQNMASLLICLVFLLLAQGYDRTAYIDLALVGCVLDPAGTLVYVRLLGPEIAAPQPPPGSPWPPSRARPPPSGREAGPRTTDTASASS